MAILYETLDSQGNKHKYFCSDEYIMGCNNEEMGIHKFVGGAKLGVDFDMGYEERGSILRTLDRVFTQPDSLARIDMKQIAIVPASIGDHLIVLNTKKERYSRDGFDLLRGKVVNIKSLE